MTQSSVPVGMTLFLVVLVETDYTVVVETIDSTVLDSSRDVMYGGLLAAS